MFDRNPYNERGDRALRGRQREYLMQQSVAAMSSEKLQSEQEL